MSANHKLDALTKNGVQFRHFNQNLSNILCEQNINKWLTFCCKNDYNHTVSLYCITLKKTLAFVIYYRYLQVSVYSLNNRYQKPLTYVRPRKAAENSLL